MESGGDPSGWDIFRGLLQDASGWVIAHREAIEAFADWSSVTRACERVGLYAPQDPKTWQLIRDANRSEDAESTDFKDLILTSYGPTGPGFEALRAELIDAPLLVDRQREVSEVLDCLLENRNFVAVCGTFPLVEYVLSNAAGKWKQPDRHDLEKRLDEVDGLTPDQEVALLLDSSALEMVRTSIPALWKSGRQDVGAVVTELNRHRVLHGNAIGWDDPKNGTEAVLLLAAAARVAGPLLQPRT